MSGTRRIKAKRLILLADQALEGPIEGQLIPSTSAATGLKHATSRVVYTIPLASVSIANGASGLMVSGAGTFSAVTPLYPAVMGSSQLPVGTPVEALGTVAFPLTYGRFIIQFRLLVGSGAALSPTFAADKLVPTGVIDVGVSDNLALSEFYSTTIQVKAFNGGLQEELFVNEIFVPYNAARTSINFTITARNQMTTAGNTLIFSGAGGASTITFIVAE